MKITHNKEQVSLFRAQFLDSPDNDLAPRETPLFLSQ